MARAPRRGVAHLRHHVGHEGLAAEAGLHGHDEEQVDVGEMRLRGGERRARLDREPHPRAALAHGAQRARHVRAGLEMHDELVGSRLAKRRREPRRLLDHQVHVEESVRQFAHRLDEDRPEGEVRHEVVVHDVAVDPVARGIGEGERLRQPREVGGQDRRRHDRRLERMRGHQRIIRPVAWSRISVARVIREPAIGRCATTVPIEGVPGGAPMRNPRDSS